MAQSKRFRRASPQRMSPLRGFAGLQGPAAGLNGGVHSSELRSSQNSSKDAPSSPGVGLAYEVIDKYLAEGRSAAEQFNRKSYSLTPTTDRTQAMVEQVFRFQSDLLPLWIDLLANLVRTEPVSNRGGSQARGPAPESATLTQTQPSAQVASPLTTAAGSSREIQLTVELVSTKMVTLSIRLDPLIEADVFRCAGLFSLDSATPPITEIELHGYSNRQLRIRLTVRENCSPGIYAGLILDQRSGEPCGTLALRIPEE
jgi:hypothetical protein